MILRRFALLVGVLLMQSDAVWSSGDQYLRSNNRRLKCGDKVSNDEEDCVDDNDVSAPVIAAAQKDSTTSVEGSTGDRVSQIDQTGASCAAMSSNSSVSTKLTFIQYYYAIESTAAVPSTKIVDLESILFVLISTAIMWCTQAAEPSVNVGGRKLVEVMQSPEFLSFAQSHRSMTLEEARGLAIVSFNNAPTDSLVEVPSDSFSEEEDPCLESEAANCVVMAGRMSIVAHVTDNLSIVVASILDAVEQVLDENLLLQPLCMEDPCLITNVAWLGETLDDVKDGAGIGGILVTGDDSNGSEGDLTADGSEGTGDENDVPIVLFAAIPMALLLAFALLLARNKRQRSVKTPDELNNLDPDDHVLTGTGDPPRSFHEGMYHYTRSGARYLSTNCACCAETRKRGFFTDADLATISEGRLYDPSSPSAGSMSSESDDASYESEEDISSHDPSAHRKKMLVEASVGNLGKKHSQIDVHQCTSATCRICSYRPRDVAFVTSPSSSQLFASAKDGLGGSHVV